MMKISQSKLSPPEVRKCFARQRLFHFFDQQLHKTLIAVTSEGGYGKTTLVSSYLKEKKLPAIWYRLEASDRNPQVFLAYLGNGLRAHVASSMPPEEPAHDEHDVTLALERVMSMLASQQERLLIVLDDYHNVREQDEIRQIMVALLQAAPPAVTFIVNGRMKPDLPLVQLKLSQQLAELSAQELAFDREEATGFFRELFALDMSMEEVQLILHKTEGWAASLVLLVDAVKNLAPLQRKHFLTHMGITEDIYSYLVTEVLGQQPDDLQHFLLHTSLVEELDPVIINEWLDMTDAQKKLDHLQSHHLFLSKDYRGAFRYHQLFKVFLYQRLKSECSLAEVNQKHAQLGKLYEKNHQLLRAFVHYTWGSEYVEAARLMKVMVNRYRPEWFLHVVDGALESLSPDHSLATTSLFLFRCVPLEILEELIPVLEESIERNQTKNSMTSRLQHRLANILFYRGDLDRALAFFRASAEGAEHVQDFALVSLNMSLVSQIYRFWGDYAEAIRYARQSLAYVEQHAIAPHVLMHGLWNLAEGLLELQDTDAAEVFLTQAIAVSAACDEASRAFPYSSMGKLYRLRQDYAQAIEWGQRAVAHAARFGIRTDVGWANKELGITYLQAQLPDLAEECLLTAQRYFRKYTYLNQIIAEWHTQVNRAKSAGAAHRDRTSAAQPEPLIVNVLGELEIRRGDTWIKITRKSSMHLFLLLLTHRGRRLTREYIMEELFPEDGVAAAQNKFYVSLSILRKSLEPGLEAGRKSAYIKQQGDSYHLSMQHVRVDADDFLRWAEGEGEESSLSAKAIERLRKAEACYKGEFLRDFPYQSFLLAEREKLGACFLRLLTRLARYYWAERQFEQGIDYYDKILTIDPYCEQIYQEYATRLLEEGHVVKAQSVYRKGKRYVEEELGIPLRIAAFPEDMQKAVRKLEAL